nr:MAG TPA: hypothetical protein [Caudoviricetes sp.]
MCAPICRHKKGYQVAAFWWCDVYIDIKGKAPS